MNTTGSTRGEGAGRGALVAGAVATAVAVLGGAIFFGVTHDGSSPARPSGPGTASGASSRAAVDPSTGDLTVPPLPTGRSALWAAANEGGNASAPRDGLADARNFDLLTALPGAYKGQLDAMKKANPRLHVLAYMNGTFAQKTEADAYDPSWYAVDATGQKITSKSFGNYLMNPRNPGWVSSRVQACQSLIDQTGYDGCMVDVLGPAPTKPGYVSSVPIDPTTQQPWTARDWMEATAALASAISKGVAPHAVIGNGLDSGLSYFEGPRTKELLAGITGGIAEGWLRRPNEKVTARRSAKEWRQDVDLLVDAERAGKTILVLPKVWSQASDEEKAAWREFAFASYLLAAGDHTYFSFSSGRDENPTAAEPVLDVEVGAPQGPYAMVGGVFRRDFEHAVSVVNPGSTPRTVTFSGQLTTTDGRRVSSLELAPYTGAVLRR